MSIAQHFVSRFISGVGVGSGVGKDHAFGLRHKLEANSQLPLEDAMRTIQRGDQREKSGFLASMKGGEFRSGGAREPESSNDFRVAALPCERGLGDVQRFREATERRGNSSGGSVDLDARFAERIDILDTLTRKDLSKELTSGWR